MKYLIRLLCLPILIGSCKQPAPETLRADDFNSDFTIAFGSCNNQHLTNVLWPEIEKNHPNVWIWGGDN
ncbi:MAG: alkaline phosphatase family protein, partial [Lutibacter sp.]|nr:alkaline phosphatase family protein [Lutibacter sp.]